MERFLLLAFMFIFAACTANPNSINRVPAAQDNAAILIDPSALVVSAVDRALSLQIGNAEAKLLVCDDAQGAQLVASAAKLLVAEAKEANARDPGVRIAFNPFHWPRKGGCEKDVATKSVMLMLKVVSVR